MGKKGKQQKKRPRKSATISPSQRKKSEKSTEEGFEVVPQQPDPGAFEEKDDDLQSAESSDSESEAENLPLDGTGAQDDSDEDEDVPDAAKEKGIVNVSFDFCDPNEKHFHSVRKFLETFTPSKGLNISDLADIIVAQASVGTLVCSEDEDVFAFITVLNLQFRKDSRSIKQITDTLASKCPQASKTEFEEILDSNKTGLVISRRMINLPLQLIPPLHSSLQDDIDWAKENEISEEHRNQFNLDHLIFLSPCEIVGAGKTVYYTHFEEEIFSQEATIQFLLNANPDMPPPSNLPPKKEGGGSAAPALKRGRSKVQGSGKGKGKGSAAAEARGAGGGSARTFACLVLGTGAYRRALPQIQRLVAGTIS